MVVSKKFSFDAAHFLPNYEGKCRNLHGHHWVVEVACSGEVNVDVGMVVDFKDLKGFCEEIEEKFDHTSLNRFFGIPTAENIARDIFKDFHAWCRTIDLNAEYVRVWESEDSMVEVREF